MYFEFIGWMLAFFMPLLGFALPMSEPQESTLQRLSAEQVIDLEMQAQDVYMQDTTNLTAEQVVDLEVAAWNQYVREQEAKGETP